MITRQEKQEFVEKVKADLKKYKVAAIVSIKGLKSSQYNAIKKKIRGDAVIEVGRKTLLTRALNEARPELKELEGFMSEAELLLLTDLPAFKIFKLLKQNKSKTFAKAGQTANNDIIVPAGETNLAPGPVLTELKQAKIDAKIQGPKIVINKDCVVARKGEVISPAVASVLSKLDIKPFEVGIEVKAVWENGVIFTPDILDVDEEWYRSAIARAHNESVAVALAAQYFTPQAMPAAITKAELQAKAIAAHVKAEDNEKKVEAQPEAQAPPTAPENPATQ
ncbi:MAG: 50S ribosomal protein L10, partial [Candidatus Norongarragalinales archaeon]